MEQDKELQAAHGYLWAAVEALANANDALGGVDFELADDADRIRGKVHDLLDVVGAMVAGVAR
jgi:hypothetical protein